MSDLEPQAHFNTPVCPSLIPSSRSRRDLNSYTVVRWNSHPARTCNDFRAVRGIDRQKCWINGEKSVFLTYVHFWGLDAVVRVVDHGLRRDQLGVAQFGGDVQTSGPQQLQVAPWRLDFGQEQVQQAHGQGENVDVARQLLAHLKHPNRKIPFSMRWISFFYLISVARQLVQREDCYFYHPSIVTFWIFS